MPVKDIIMIASEISAGAIVTFLAIILWSQTREVEWVLIIVGVILKYAEILNSAFASLGIIRPDIYIIPDLIDVSLVLKLLPMFFYAAAFITRLVKIKNSMEY